MKSSANIQTKWLRIQLLLTCLSETFTDWFTSYVNSVVSGGFPIIRDQIFRYFTQTFLVWNDYKSEKNIKLHIMR